MQITIPTPSQDLETLLDALRNDLRLPIRSTLQGLVNRHAVLFLELRRRRVTHTEIVLLLQQSSDRFNNLSGRTLSKSISRLKATGAPLTQDLSSFGVAAAMSMSIAPPDGQGSQAKPPTAVPTTQSTNPEIRSSASRLAKIYQHEDEQ